MIKGVYSSIVKHSLIIATSRVIKYLNSDIKVIFTSPCIDKKPEAREKNLIVYVNLTLTFGEIKELFEIININLSQLQETTSSKYISRCYRLYAKADSVTKL